MTEQEKNFIKKISESDRKVDFTLQQLEKIGYRYIKTGFEKRLCCFP